MIPELGFFALILSLLLALALMVIPAAGVFAGNALLMRAARPLAAGQLVMVSISLALLTAAFLADDFSVAIVAAQSNTLLPSVYKFTAVWGGHEGSMLLWVWVMALWTLAVATFSKRLPLDMVARVLAVMGALGVGFIAFLLFTSNPFARLLPNPPLDGADLNPLLQDPGMVIHPPMLYFGYVGFSVAFAFAIAALWGGRLDATWARWSRPWTTAAWIFLTLGIALGSWWAYYELGWGGWWFWDPVENASFMPWLAGTALMHSLAVTDKRGLFKSWTVLLAIFTFSLSLLGAFLVRSGVLTSVHSFAADPSRGLFILAFLGVVVGGSLTLYALRAPAVASRSDFSALSREMLLLVNNVLLLVATLTVLSGTLFPLLADALELGKYSVGPPYFNAVFIPLMAVLLAFLGVGINTQWKRSRGNELRRLVLPAAIASLAIGVIFPWAYGGAFHIGVVVTMVLAAWVVLATLADLRHKLRHARGWWQGLRRLAPAYHGMVIAHIGLAITVVGVGLTSVYSEEQDVRMVEGSHAELAGYQFLLTDLSVRQGPNFVAQRGTVEVSHNGRPVATLYPEKRSYHARPGQLMTEAGIDPGLFRDIFVALGEPLEGGEAWAVRLQHKPFVRWIWLGALVMSIGGLIAALDRRYRPARREAVDRADAQTGPRHPVVTSTPAEQH